MVVAVLKFGHRVSAYIVCKTNSKKLGNVKVVAAAAALLMAPGDKEMHCSRAQRISAV